MAIAFGTETWARALVDTINASSAYRDAAAGWGRGFNGNVLLAVEADALRPRPINLLVRLREGTCQGASFVDGPGHDEAGFVLSGPFSAWRDVLEGRTPAAAAILGGTLRVEGDMMTLLRHAAAHRALVACCAALATDFDAA